MTLFHFYVPLNSSLLELVPVNKNQETGSFNIAAGGSGQSTTKRGSQDLASLTRMMLLALPAHTASPPAHTALSFLLTMAVVHKLLMLNNVYPFELYFSTKYLLTSSKDLPT